MSISSLGNNKSCTKHIIKPRPISPLFDETRLHLDKLGSDYANAVNFSNGMIASPRAARLYGNIIRSELVGLSDGTRILDTLDNNLPNDELTYLTTRTQAPDKPNSVPYTAWVFKNRDSDKDIAMRDGIQTIVQCPHDLGWQFKDQSVGTSSQTILTHELTHAYDLRLVSLHPDEHEREIAIELLHVPESNPLDKNQLETNAVQVETEMATRRGEGVRPHYFHPCVEYTTQGFQTAAAKHCSDEMRLVLYRCSVVEADKESAKIAMIEDELNLVSRRLAVQKNFRTKAFLRARYARLSAEALARHEKNQAYRDDAWHKLEKSIQPIFPDVRRV